VRALMFALVVGFGVPAASALSNLPPPTVELQYVRGSDAEGCLGEGELHGRLAAELGYDPFTAPAAGSGREALRIRWGRRRGVWSADLELISPGGGTVAQQTLRSNDPSCAALGTAVEVAVSVMFDRVQEPPRPRPSEAQLLALAPLAEITLPPQPAPPRPPVHFSAGLLVVFGANFGPEPALQLSARWTSWSLDLEGRYEAFESYGSAFAIRRTLVAIAPCVWSGTGGGVGFCPVLMGGSFEVLGASGQVGSLPILATGARVAVSAPIWGPIALRIQGGVVFPLLGGSTTVGGQELTEPRVMTLDFGAGLSVQIF
jgi:hypothetical protein